MSFYRAVGFIGTAAVATPLGRSSAHPTPRHGTYCAREAGHAILVGAALAVGIVAGWGVGAARGTCEHTCPAQGPCPTPADCLNQPFNWTAAIVLGLVVTAVIVAVGVALLNRAPRD